MSFAEDLRAAADAEWQAMQEHRFVRAIEEDSLDQAVFRRYLVYEHAFVETAVTLFGYALVKAPGLAEARYLIGTLRALVDEQIPYFMNAFDRLGMAEAEWKDVPLPPRAAGLRDGMIGFAAHGGFEEVVAAMLAAEWTYATWCARAAARPIGNPEVKAWVDLHADPAFQDQAGWLIGQIDRRGPDLPAERRRRCIEIFRSALALEIEFHHAPFA
jgi:thiaminase (transcriptional activator TenA)